MISKEEAYLDFLIQCESHKEQQESYRMSLQIGGTYSVAKPCCSRFQSSCFEDYYNNLVIYLNGGEFNWECVFERSKIFYTQGRDKYVSIDETKKKCRELGINLG